MLSNLGLTSCLLLAGWSANEPGVAPQVELPPAVERRVTFVEDVAPLLKRACWNCHAAETRESGLRLDLKDKALAGGDGGRVIVSGRSEESRLIHLVSGRDPDRIMPPDGDRLTAAEIGILRAWIDQGLDWPESAVPVDDPTRGHWSFQPITRPAVPAATKGSNHAHPIDRFVEQKLADKGITPSPRADRATLIRRLSLDLLGLPPAPDEVAEFVADSRDDAYERLVDRLLASAHFGERWGRHWLDLARYADSDGYEKDLARPHAYRYRDWVIDAFNRDIPFDEFTIQQLAGDLLPNPTLDQLLATGFHRQTLTNREGGIDPREDRDKQLVDRTNTTGAVWMGLTVGCAQCHSHKYDPLSQREYFQLYAFFDGAKEDEIPAPTEREAERYAAAQQVHKLSRAPFIAAIEEYRQKTLPTKLQEWEQRLKSEPVAWEPATVASVKAESQAKFSQQADGSWLAEGTVPDVDTYTVTLPLGSNRPTGLLLETIPRSDLGGGGAGRASNGNFVITHVRATFQPTDMPKSPAKPLPVVAAQADYRQGAGTPQEFLPSSALDGDSKTGWAVGGAIDKTHHLLLELDWPDNVAPEADITLSLVLEQRYGGQHVLGSFRLLSSTSARPLSLPQMPSEIAAILKASSTERTPAQQTALLDYYSSIDPELVKLRDSLKQFDARAPQPPATRAMVFASLDRPEPTRIHLRGDFLSPGEPVVPQVPEVLNSLESSGDAPNRLDLARWLVSEEHPLTRRVAVNRIWQQLFGRGLVDPPDDFGLRGTPPSHPELLDWLASEFLARGWSRKEMIRLIVTSETYQRSSATRTDLAEIDPKNLLLARQNRFRLTGEVLRDLALDVSGLLDDRVGGPSIRPPLPAGVADLGYAGSVKWKESEGGDRYRRGCYIFFQRTVPYPLLMTFDSPDSNVTCQRREISNTPLQSLTLLNDPAFVECARALGFRVLKSGGESTSDRLQSLVTWTLGRDPVDQELAVLFQMHAEASARFQAHPEEAAELVGKTEANELPSSAAHESATWISLARIVLNLDEFMTRP